MGQSVLIVYSKVQVAARVQLQDDPAVIDIQIVMGDCPGADGHRSISTGKIVGVFYLQLVEQRLDNAQAQHGAADWNE